MGETGTPGPQSNLPPLVHRTCVSLSLLVRAPLFQEAFQVAPTGLSRLVSPAAPAHTQAHTFTLSSMNSSLHLCP